MKAVRITLALIAFLGPVLAQDVLTPSTPAKQSAETREARHRLDLVGTRAIANFHVMDSIEQNLNSLGVTLHPQIVALRLRVEAVLNSAEANIDRNDLSAANENMDQADALLQRLASRIGGS